MLPPHSGIPTVAAGLQAVMICNNEEREKGRHKKMENGCRCDLPCIVPHYIPDILHSIHHIARGQWLGLTVVHRLGDWTSPELNRPSNYSLLADLNVAVPLLCLRRRACTGRWPSAAIRGHRNYSQSMKAGVLASRVSVNRSATCITPSILWASLRSSVKMGDSRHWRK